ncbi:unnamed protein product [Clonostachys rosea f. rosea IK726]|uniref:Uncharacterized protein n=1 Tax=Clonostachys rosea f. rosea IK726 TaxID=1349383 RepID=A0ACA9UX06_BIOOC|nr:unnamed protein product [Clonostachys rosea f. rosea IK726]
MMINEAKRLGIPILFNAVVDDYFENQHEAGVKLRNGETLTADLVIAADGTHSKSGKLVHNNTVHATPSGFSVYRTCYPAEIALADPLVKARWGPGHNAGQEVFQFYLGPDSHANVLFGKGTCCWSLFHRDTSDTSDENWSAHLNPEDAIAEFDKIGGWDPALMALVRTTPRGGVNDHRMMWRDPQPVQTSPLGRVAQIGDACHTFLPTSANGAVQAMEDGASLAACLRLGGKDRITLSTRVHALLRFERVSSAQLMGFMTRQTLHHADWEVIKNDSMKVRRGPGAWIGGHDVEQYAIDNFEAAALHITDGTPFANTNLPKNYTYKPWNIQTLNKEMESPDFTVSEILMDQAD